jgi:4'-phosphopantetheinyl transferase
MSQAAPGSDRVSPPPRPDGEIHVWEADLDRGEWPSPRRLPPPERERAERIRRAPARRRWVAARWALRGVLARYLGGEPAAVELGVEANGKPRLAPAGVPLRFNLSHSHDLAVVAVTLAREVGVDVEWIDRERDLERLAPRALGPRGAEAVRAAPAASRPEVFHAAWARREAIGKCLGVGLATPPPGRSAAVLPLAVPPGFAGAVAIAAKEVPPLRRFAIDARGAVQRQTVAP